MRGKKISTALLLLAILAALAFIWGNSLDSAVESAVKSGRVRELLQLAQDPISLETPVGEEEDAHLEDFIQDEEAGVPVDEAGRQLLRRELMNVLKSLTPREERVIALRFGLEDGRSRTLEELGREFNVTRERVRQIEAKALRKLRHPSSGRCRPSPFPPAGWSGRWGCPRRPAPRRYTARPPGG